MKYSKRTVDEAVQLLDVYASQMATQRKHLCIPEIAALIGVRQDGAAWNLAYDAWWSFPLADEWGSGYPALRIAGAEAAQRLREGWRP